MLEEHDVAGANPVLPLKVASSSVGRARTIIILTVLLNMASSLMKTTTVERGGIKLGK